MKVAVSHWQGRISPVFDVAGEVWLVEIEGRRIVRRKEVRLRRRDVWGRAQELANLGVALLICGAISHPLENALSQTGIRVIGFTCGEIEVILSALQGDRLNDPCFRMPGCGKAQSSADSIRVPEVRRTPVPKAAKIGRPVD